MDAYDEGGVRTAETNEDLILLPGVRGRESDCCSLSSFRLRPGALPSVNGLAPRRMVFVARRRVGDPSASCFRGENLDASWEWERLLPGRMASRLRMSVCGIDRTRFESDFSSVASFERLTDTFASKCRATGSSSTLDGLLTMLVSFSGLVSDVLAAFSARFASKRARKPPKTSPRTCAGCAKWFSVRRHRRKRQRCCINRQSRRKCICSRRTRITCHASCTQEAASNRRM